MKFYNIKKKLEIVDFKTAIFRGVATKGGLFMPLKIPSLPSSFFSSIQTFSFQDIAFEVSKALLGDSLPKKDLEAIVHSALDFDVPLIQIDDKVFVLELFHGPTFAFKDVGARFLARVMSFFSKLISKKIIILVATSGDTGSAVGHGFLDLDGIEVILLYPSSKVSQIQEKQLTTIGRNVRALEVLGTFDDCQDLVKRAFSDNELTQKHFLTSANSINIARLLPQSFYYFWAYAQLKKILSKNIDQDFIFSVPSGNFGNLTAGLIAKKMGLPVYKFIAATNLNDTFPRYTETGIFKPKPSVQTISNAMDVGMPNNFPRIQSLYSSLSELKKDIWSVSVSEEETKQTLSKTYLEKNYLLDPHGAIGLNGFRSYQHLEKYKGKGIILETAHPAKFADIVSPILQQEISMPSKLQTTLNKPKESIVISNNYKEFKRVIIEKYIT